VKKWLAVVLVAVLFLGLAVKAVDKSYRRGDLRIFLVAGKGIIENAQPYAGSSAGAGFIYPPYFAVLMVPFAAAPRAVGATAWFLLNFAALVLLFATSLYLLERPSARMAPWLRAKLRVLWNGKVNGVVAAAVVITGPLWLENINFGTINIQLWALALLGVYFAAGGKRVVAGILLGAAVSPKFFAAPVLLYLLIRKEYRVVAYALATVALLYGAPAALLGWGRNAALLGVWYGKVIAPAKGAAFAYGMGYNISLMAVIYRLCEALRFCDAGSVYRTPFLFNALNLALAALSLSPLAFYALKRRDGGEAGPRHDGVADGLRLSLIIVCGLLFIPFTWGAYYVAAALPVMAVLYAQREITSRRARLVCPVLLALFFVAFACFTSSDIWGKGKAVFYYYGLVTAGGLSLYAAVVVALLSRRRPRPAGRERGTS
jgi:hypothetical protein